MIELLLVGVAIFGVLGFFVLAGANSSQKDSEAKSEKILDEAFDGTETVVFKIHMQSIKYETAILGAKARGYSLLSQSGGAHGANTLIFEKNEVAS